MASNANGTHHNRLEIPHNTTLGFIDGGEHRQRLDGPTGYHQTTDLLHLALLPDIGRTRERITDAGTDALDLPTAFNRRTQSILLKQIAYTLTGRAAGKKALFLPEKYAYQ